MFLRFLIFLTFISCDDDAKTRADSSGLSCGQINLTLASEFEPYTDTIIEEKVDANSLTISSDQIKNTL